MLLPLTIACANSAPPSPSIAGASRQRESAEGAPWPGWLRMEAQAAESLLTSCAGRHPGYWSLQKGETGTVSPRAARPRRASRWDALPVAPLPSELAQPAVSGAERRVVEGEKAWLVALDAGEFGDGSSGIATAAHWQGNSIPVHFSDAVQRDVRGALYVSFGPVVARFEPGAMPAWFGPQGSKACGPE